MHQILTKHANAADTFGSDFADQLEPGESLNAGTQALTVWRGRGSNFNPTGPWTDVTAEFIDGSVQILGTIVTALFKAKSAAEQAGSVVYVVRAEVETSNNRRLVDTWVLDVTDEATAA